MFEFVDTFAKWLTFKTAPLLFPNDKDKITQAETILKQDEPMLVTGIETTIDKMASIKIWIKRIVVISGLSVIAYFGYKLYKKFKR